MHASYSGSLRPGAPRSPWVERGVSLDTRLRTPFSPILITPSPTALPRPAVCPSPSQTSSEDGEQEACGPASCVLCSIAGSPHWRNGGSPVGKQANSGKPAWPNKAALSPGTLGEPPPPTDQSSRPLWHLPFTWVEMAAKDHGAVEGEQGTRGGRQSTN